MIVLIIILKAIDVSILQSEKYHNWYFYN